MSRMALADNAALGRKPIADNHHALSLEQAAHGGEEPRAVVDDEAPCVHNSSLASGPLVRIPASRNFAS